MKWILRLSVAMFISAYSMLSAPCASPQSAEEINPITCPEVIIADPKLSDADENTLQSLEKAHLIATGVGVKVAIIDTGVSPHPRLPPLIPAGDLVGAHQIPDLPGEFVDCDGHGTIVAGIIATQPHRGTEWPYADNVDSIVGVAPDVELIVIKQTSAYVNNINDADSKSIGTLTTLSTAIHRAIDAGADIINISVVSCVLADTSDGSTFIPLTDALSRAENSGVLIVAAAGNLSHDCPVGATVQPASSDTVLAVSARLDSHTIAAYSLPHSQPLLSAPGQISAGISPRGEGFISALRTPSGESSFEGTSFAAPVVSATAALIKQRNPAATPLEMRNQILTSVDPARGTIDPYVALTHQELSAKSEAHYISASELHPSNNSLKQRALMLIILLAVLAVSTFIVLGRLHSK